MPENIQDTLNERGARYGDFTDHAQIAQALQYTLHTAPGTSGDGQNRANWYKLDAVQRQAVTVICDKLARIVSGDPNYDDNWRDMSGYSTLVLERLPTNSAPAPIAPTEDAHPELPLEANSDEYVAALRRRVDDLEKDQLARYDYTLKLSDTVSYLLNTFVPWEVRNYVEGCPYEQMPVEYEAARKALKIDEPTFINPGNQPTKERFARGAPDDRFWRDPETGALRELPIDLRPTTARYRDQEQELQALRKERMYLTEANRAWQKRFTDLASLTPPKTARIFAGKDGMIDFASEPDQTAIASLRNGKVEDVLHVVNGYAGDTLINPLDASIARNAYDELSAMMEKQLAHRNAKDGAVDAIERLRRKGADDAFFKAPRALLDTWEEQRAYDYGYDSQNSVEPATDRT